MSAMKPGYVDPDMQELLDVLSRAVVPRGNREEVVRVNWHTPHYSRGRYSRL